MCLVVDPAQRPSVDAVLAQLYNVSDRLGENMEAPSVSWRVLLEGVVSVQSSFRFIYCIKS